MQQKFGVTLIEIAMLVVVLMIVSFAAIPNFSKTNNPEVPQVNLNRSIAKVQTAFALAIAHKGDFPGLSEIVDFIDADFASEKNDMSGIIFRDGVEHISVSTFIDDSCKVPTNDKLAGISDIVRCVQYK